MTPSSDVTVPVPDPVLVTVSVLSADEGRSHIPRRAHRHGAGPGAGAIAGPAGEDGAGGGGRGQRDDGAVGEARAARGAAVDTGEVGSDEPSAEPALLTVSTWVGGPKSAATSRAWLMVTRQCRLVPEQSPDQPLKTEAPEAVAVSVTSVPGGVRCAAGGAAVDAADVRSHGSGTRPARSDLERIRRGAAERGGHGTHLVHGHDARVAMPEHAPNQLSSVCPDAGVAVSVTRVPAP